MFECAIQCFNNIVWKIKLSFSGLKSKKMDVCGSIVYQIQSQLFFNIYTANAKGLPSFRDQWIRGCNESTYLIISSYYCYRHRNHRMQNTITSKFCEREWVVWLIALPSHIKQSRYKSLVIPIVEYAPKFEIHILRKAFLI